MSENNHVKLMILAWKLELKALKERLSKCGSEAHKMEYNILSAEALRLSVCITDATESLFPVDESRRDDDLE